MVKTFEKSSAARTPYQTKRVLWANVAALMRHKYGRENINRLAGEAKVGVATVQRIKAMKTSVGLDVLDAVAESFGLRAWQLLLPDLDPSNPPMSMITDDEKRLYERLKRVDAILKDERQ